MDQDLAIELITMADAQERAVIDFSTRALRDPSFGDVVRRRLGWHPADDPVDLWGRADRAPRPPWLAEWSDDLREATVLTQTVAGHTERLGDVVEATGWPGRSLVGEDGADAAWMLAMHADRDPTLQRVCAELLIDAAANGEADPRHYATLVDRIACVREGVQYYGTLASRGPGGPHFLARVEEPETLARRREAVGLPPLVDDLAMGVGQLPYRQLRRTPTFAWPQSAPRTRARGF